MKISFGADSISATTNTVITYIKDKGWEYKLYGKIAEDGKEWVDTALAVANDISTSKSDFGILMCWTGAGVAMVANKVKNVRAALCLMKIMQKMQNYIMMQILLQCL